MLPLLLTDSSRALYEQVYEFYKNEILSRRLKSGTRIPSLRKLAADLDVSTNTIIRAYEQLQHEGYVVNLPRKGLFVEKLDKIYLHNKHEKTIQKTQFKKLKYNLSQACIDQKNFPLQAWRKSTLMAIDSFHSQIHHYEETAGLKEELSKYLYTSRGVKSSPEQIVICGGTNTLLSLLCYIFRSTHKQIVFEEPGYEEGRTLFHNSGFKILPVGVTRQGLDLEALPNIKNALAYVTPSHQFPTGAVMPVSHRIKLIQWAARTNSYIIEDDYDSEFRYKGNPIPSLQAIDNSGHVIYTGTFSKVLMPSLRVAYMVLPQQLLPRNSEFEYAQSSVSHSVQKTLALFIQNGFWERHIRKMRKIYRRKYELTDQYIRKVFGTTVSYHSTHAGLYFVITIKTKLTTTTLIDKAAEKGIYILSDEPCYYEKRNSKKPSLFFGFGGLEINEIEAVLQILRKVWGL